MSGVPPITNWLHAWSSYRHANGDKHALQASRDANTIRRTDRPSGARRPAPKHTVGRQHSYIRNFFYSFQLLHQKDTAQPTTIIRYPRRPSGVLRRQNQSATSRLSQYTVEMQTFSKTSHDQANDTEWSNTYSKQKIQSHHSNRSIFIFGRHQGLRVNE